MRRLINIAGGAFLAFAAGSATLAQDRAVVPNFFDPQDRFEKPDLTDLPRLRFLTVTDFPPFSYIDADRALVGYHVELAREICDRLDVEAKCEIQALPFADLEKALADGEGEAILAGIAVTGDTRGRLAFTRPYFRLPARFAAPAGRVPSERLGSGLQGLNVAVRRGSAHEAYLRTFFPGATPVPVAGNAEAAKAVADGEAGLVFSDALGLARFMASADGADWSFVDEAFGDPNYFGGGLAIAVRPGEDELLNALNHALVALNERRVLEELYLRHFPIGLY